MVSLPDDLWARPEVAELSDAAFRAFVAGWCYAHQHRTDGYLPAGAVRVLGMRRLRRRWRTWLRTMASAW